MQKFLHNSTKIVAFAIVVLFPSTVLADTFECRVPKAVLDYMDRWVNDRYIFEYDPDQGAANVSDPLSEEYAGRRMLVDVQSSDPEKLVFSWKIPVKNRVGRHTVMMYRAVIFDRGVSFQIRATANNFYIANSDGRGSCRLLAE